MIGPMLRICPECGHENWGLTLHNGKGHIQLPPPKTCENCDEVLIAPVRQKTPDQACLPGVA